MAVAWLPNTAASIGTGRGQPSTKIGVVIKYVMFFHSTCFLSLGNPVGLSAVMSVGWGVTLTFLWTKQQKKQKFHLQSENSSRSLTGDIPKHKREPTEHKMSRNNFNKPTTEFLGCQRI
jgi:hypothetical protein